MTTKDHYDNHLGIFYSWMIGDFEAGTDEQYAFFASHDIVPKEHRHAIDLGCGNGYKKSVPIKNFGFRKIPLKTFAQKKAF